MFLYLILFSIPLLVLWFRFCEVDLVLLLYILKRKVIAPPTKSRFDDKVVWITGASSGIGEALAYRLAACNCKLVLSARRKDELEKVKDRCKQKNPSLEDENILVLPFDMTDIDDHKDLVDKVLKQFTRIDAVVLNAGRSQRSNILQSPYEVIKAVHDLNFMSVVSLTKCILPHMIENKSGSFVTTSSVASKFGVAACAAYSSSKHALNGFFDSLRYEVAEHGIDVLTVCPGFVSTYIIKNAYVDSINQTNGDQINIDTSQVGKESPSHLSPDQCAEYMVIAMEERLKEAWVSKQPLLLALYISQYFPSSALFILTHLGNKARKTGEMIRSGAAADSKQD